MAVSAGKTIVMIVIVVLAAASVVKGVIMAFVMLMLRMFMVPVRRGIILIMIVMMWKIGVTITVAITVIIRPSAVIIASVGHDIASTVGFIPRIIGIMRWIISTSAEQ